MLDRVLFKTKEYFPSALFPKLWNSIELEFKETKSAKLFKRKIFKNYLDSYASYICKKISAFHVDKLSLCYLLHPVIHKHDSNIACYPLLQPSRLVPALYLFTPSLPYSWFIIIVLFKMYTVQCTSIYLFTILIRL